MAPHTVIIGNSPNNLTLFVITLTIVIDII